VLRARASINGEAKDEGEADPDVAQRRFAAAAVLSGLGQGLRRGDRIITGLIVQVPIAPGERLETEISALGSVQLSIVA
jgi:hypothetical protein